jgi:hypothetical protein
MLDDARQRRRQELKRLRDQRHRERLRACKAVALVEYDGAVLDLLLRTGWAREEELSDAHAVGRAISAMLADSART